MPFTDAVAQIEQQRLEPLFFFRLSNVVRGPVLWIGTLFRARYRESPSHGLGAVFVFLALHNERGRENVLTGGLPSTEVRTLTRLSFWRQMDTVYSGATLRRNHPPSVTLADCPRRRQFQTALESQVHTHPIYSCGILLDRYILVKENILLDGILFYDISSAHDIDHDQTSGLSLYALRTRVGASKEHKRRTLRVSKVQIPLLEQAQAEMKFGGGGSVLHRHRAITNRLLSVELPPPQTGMAGNRPQTQLPAYPTMTLPQILFKDSLKEKQLQGFSNRSLCRTCQNGQMSVDCCGKPAPGAGFLGKTTMEAAIYAGFLGRS